MGWVLQCNVAFCIGSRNCPVVDGRGQLMILIILYGGTSFLTARKSWIWSQDGPTRGLSLWSLYVLPVLPWVLWKWKTCCLSVSVVLTVWVSRMLGTVLLCKVYTGHKAWYTRQGIHIYLVQGIQGILPQAQSSLELQLPVTPNRISRST